MVKFIPKHFIVFDAVVNGIIFFGYFIVSAQKHHRLLYVDVTPTTLPDSLTSSSSFLVEFSTYKIVTPANNDRFFFPFHLGCLLFHTLLITLARTPNSVWNVNGDSGHPVLFLILEKKLLISLQ